MRTPRFNERESGRKGARRKGRTRPLSPLPPFSLFLLLALLLAAPAVRAQLAEGGARALGVGRAATALEGEAWGEFNPATWAALRAPTADLLASQAFGLDALRLVALAAAYPTPYATLAGNARTYGGEGYRETRLGLGAARAVPISATRRLGLGLQVQLHSVSIEGFGSASTVSV